ncbi:hypothetical protein [Deinococcus sonorensis]|uniref:MarR family transcriptional regulator n=2 Tax=Deinococcus sonorensis TaxID=309891 RepID=A0AAU7UDP4_9DEIO
MPTREWLEHRNRLWLALRQEPPGSAEFERLLEELARLIHWDRPRILAALGLSEPDTAP